MNAASICLWFGTTCCLTCGMLRVEDDEAPPPPPPKPIPITIVEAKLETREVPAKPSSFRDMAALPGFAVLVNDRSLSILRAGKDTPEPAAVLLRVPEGIDYFGCTREAGGSIFIEAGEYPEETLRKEAETPRGGFVSGPTSKGLLVITDTPPSVRRIKRCRVTHWPGAPGEHKQESILPGMQDLRMIGDKLHLASYGMLGILDPVKETWHCLDYDDGMAFNRNGPVLGPENTLFIGMDEGGLGGAWVNWTRGTKSGGIDLRPGYDPRDLLALGNRVFVATDHGLAEITDPASEPLARHFVDRANGSSPLGPTTALLAHGKTLLAVAGDRILHLDLERHSATLYRLTVKQPLTSICRFDGHFYGVGPGPLVRFDLP